MKTARKLSIIIISKNEEKLIGKLLESLRRQEFPIPHEIILADNKSTDATVRIARRYGVTVVSGGLPGAGRNAGARRATGDLLLFLDADTELLDGFITRNIAEFFRRDLAIAAPMVRVNTRNPVHAATFHALNLGVVLLAPVLPHAIGVCIFCTADLNRAIGGFNETMRSGEDGNYVLRASRAGGRFGALRSVPIMTTARRLEKDGMIRSILRGLQYVGYRIVAGEEKAGALSYDFDHSATVMHTARRVVHRLSRKTLFPLFSKPFNIRCSGLEHISPNENYIFAMNHQSALDPMAAAAILVPHTNRHLSTLLHKCYYDFPLLALLFRRWQAVRVDPDNQEGRTNSIKDGIAKLAQGNNVLVFPEGAVTTQDKPLLRAHTGVIKLAIMSRKKIVPVGVRGTYHAWRFPHAFPKNPFSLIYFNFKYPVEFVFGAPIDLRKYYALDLAQQTQKNKCLLRIQVTKLMTKIGVLAGQPYLHDVVLLRR